VARLCVALRRINDAIQTTTSAAASAEDPIGRIVGHEAVVYTIGLSVTKPCASRRRCAAGIDAIDELNASFSAH